MIAFVRTQPLLSIALFSFVITALLLFVYSKLMPKQKLEQLRAEARKLQRQLKTASNEKKLALQQELMRCSLEQMRLGLKPMLITALPLLLALLALKRLYEAAGVGVIIKWQLRVPLLCSVVPGVCDGAGWFLCYVLFGLVFSFILRKCFRL